MRGIELAPEHPVDRLVDLGIAAEEEGFDALFATSHYNNRDPFLVLDRIAESTSEIRIGPGVLNPYDSHPVIQASRAATLQEASDGRALYGIGAGDRSTLSNLGIERNRPVRRVLEAFSIARELWSGERIEHDGTFRAADAGLNYAVEPLPVYVGAQGPDMIRMAAKHADGVLINASHPLDLSWAADRIAEGLEERHEDRSQAADVDRHVDFESVAYASVSVSEDREAAREAARIPVAFIAAGASPYVLERHGIDVETTEMIGKRIGSGEFREAGEAVTAAMLDAFCVAGTPAEIEDRLTELLEHVDGVVVGSPLGPDLDRAIELTGAALERIV